jgi:hypothetical protein
MMEGISISDFEEISSETSAKTCAVMEEWLSYLAEERGGRG